MGILKTVIGVKTFGVFLPVLIAISFNQTGLIVGLILFLLIVGIVCLINWPLNYWRIQYSSKVTLLMIAVVCICLVLANVMFHYEMIKASAPLIFPIIILTMLCEKLSRKIDEEGIKEALTLFGSTMLATLLIYIIISSSVIQEFLITFPEIIFSLAGLNLLLGKWLGLRLTEYYRFYKVVA